MLRLNEARKSPIPQYDIAELSRKYGITAVKAKAILDAAGDSREAADLMAMKSRPREIAIRK